MNAASLLADAPDGPWVDDLLLAGPDDERCLALDQPITRENLRNLVTERQTHLHGAGLRAGGTVALSSGATGPPKIIGRTAAGLVAEVRRHPRLPATPLGNMYGTTEVGVIATDLSGRLAPAVQPTPGPLTINGRLDSQVSIGGLKVDLTAEEIQADLGERLAAYKRPRSPYVLGDFPRTTTDKIVQGPVALRSVARDAAVR
jgi:hypothetical protein